MTCTPFRRVGVATYRLTRQRKNGYRNRTVYLRSRGVVRGIAKTDGIVLSGGGRPESSMDSLEKIRKYSADSRRLGRMRIGESLKLRWTP